MIEDLSLPFNGVTPSTSDSGAFRPARFVPPRLVVLTAFFWTFPILWILGAVPLAPFLVVAVGVLEALANPHAARYSLYESAGTFALLVGALIGFLQLADPVRILTWTHDVVVILAMVLIVNAVRRTIGTAHVLRLDRGLRFFIAFVVLTGAGALLMPGHLQYETPLLHLLPKHLAETDYAKALFQIQPYTVGWFAHREWRRVKAVSMFATSLAAMLCVWSVYAAGQKRNRLSDWAVLGGGLIVLLATLDRTSTVAAIFGIAVVAFVRLGVRGKVLVVLAAGTMVTLVLLTSAESATNAFNQFLTLRGGGSYYSRLQGYSETFKAIMDNPWGHGSEQRVQGLALPLGSHSTWLALFYKFGIFGLGGFVLYATGTVRQLVRSHRSEDIASLAAGLGIVLATAIISIFEELYLDSTTAIVIATIIGMALRPSIPHFGDLSQGVNKRAFGRFI